MCKSNSVYFCVNDCKKGVRVDFFADERINKLMGVKVSLDEFLLFAEWLFAYSTHRVSV